MGWEKVSIPRIRFDRIGNNLTLDWTNVRGVKFVYKAVAGASGTPYFDNLVVIAGADGKALTGVFRAKYVYLFKDGRFTDESLSSPVSEKIGLNAQALKLTIPRQSAMAMDPQITHVQPYIWSSQLGAFYRTVNPLSMNRPKRTLNEFGCIEPDGVISADDRMRILTLGRRPGRRYTPGTDPVYEVSRPGTGSTTVTDSSAYDSVDYATGDGYSGSGFLRTWNPVTGTETIAFSVSNLPVSDASAISVTVSLTFTVNRTGTGSVTYRHICRIGGVLYVKTSPTVTYEGTGSYSSSALWDVNPVTNAAWTVAERNSAKFGVLFFIDEVDPTDSIAITAFTVANTYTTAGTAGNTVTAKNVLTFRIRTSETELLLLNDTLDTNRESVPDNIIGMIGDYFGRTVLLTDTHLYFSDLGRPSSYPIFQKIKVADGVNERCLWVTRGAGGIIIGTTLDIYYLLGNLTQFPNGTIDAVLKPMNISSPPVNSSVAREGMAMAYLASDGPRTVIGQQSEPLKGDLDNLLKGLPLNGVPNIDPTVGRHCLAMARGYLYWSVFLDSVDEVTVNERKKNEPYVHPSGRRRLLTFGRASNRTSYVFRLTLSTSKWTCRRYPFEIMSLTRDFNGDVYAGTNNGKVIALNKTFNDDGDDVQINIQTPHLDDGSPLARKVPFDFQMRVDTGGDDVTVALHLDGDDTPATSFTVNTPGQSVFMKSLEGLPEFRRASLRVYGSVGTRFKWWDWNLSYRNLPQHHHFLDTGNVQTGKEFIHHFKEIRLNLKSDHNVTVKVYFDDVLYATETVTVTPGVTRPYTIMLARDVRGRQPRVSIETTNAASYGEDGFEIYWIEWKVKPTGNQMKVPVIRWTAQ